MNIALIVFVCIVVLIVVGVIVFEIWSQIAYRRWRKWFDSLPPDEQRKEQERLYKARQFSDAEPQ